MENNKKALVLEGGGMRGAYTAGCLSWLIDNGISFDEHYGISTGALHLCSYILEDKDYLHEISTKYIADKSSIGVRSVIKEGRIVSYDHLFNKLEKEIKFDFKGIQNSNKSAKIGLYDLGKSKTIFMNIQDITKDHLKAACSLPLIGKVVNIGENKYLDGGITEMIPINESLYDGNKKNLIIATKPMNFVRKPANPLVVKLMRLVYKDCKSIGEDYAIRHLNYEKQMTTIRKQVDSGNAIYMYPSESVKVSRLSGDPETLDYLYNLGRKDMENNSEKIYALFK